ncbi:Integral membrane protein [plant metagenome]|uniref:Integral membrane protein n=1 Tax=plant metagenome TaxID=1297885 RepID=A0A484QD81_9ZZZZ
MHPSSSPSPLPTLALIGAMASLCLGTSFAKTLFPAVGAQGTTAYRITVGALILLAIWRPWRFPLTRSQARTVVLYGTTLACLNLCFYMALRTLPLGVAIAIEFTGPLTLALVLSRRVLDFIWIALAAAGLLLLMPSGVSAHQLDPTGLAYAATAGVFWALYIIFGQRAGSLHGGQATALGMTVAALITLPIGVAHAGAALFDPSLILAGLVVGVLSSALPYSLEMVALKGLTKKTFGVLLSLEPAMGAVAGVIVLGEHLAVPQWLAIGAIVAASAGCAATARRRMPPAPAPAKTD